MDQEVTQEAVQDGQAPETVVEEPGQGGGYDKGDYISRVMNEPDFAAEQVREKDRKINEAKQALKKYEPLANLIDSVGADELLGYIQEGYTVRSNPQIAEIVQEFARTGQLPTAQPAGQVDDDDPYEDPSVKALKAELREVRATLEQVRGESNQRFAQAETRSFQAGIEKNITSIMDEFAPTDQLKTELAELINSRIEQAQKLAQKGDQQALKMLEMVGGTNGAETLRHIIAPVVLRDDNMRAIAAARETRRAKTVARQDTGAPSAARTAGGGEQSSAVKYAPGFVREALEKATRQAGSDPNRLW